MPLRISLGRRSPVFGLFIVASLAAAPSGQTLDDVLPLPFPRDGATQLLDHPRVLVWDIAWLTRRYPLHRHVYDLVGVFYAPGDRKIIARDGTERLVSTKAWDTPFQRAGLVHIEEGISVEPLRAVFLELKEPAATGQVDQSTSPVAIGDALGPALVDNERTRVWHVPRSVPTSDHRHALDGVVVAFRSGRPSVVFVARGLVHRDEGTTDADRVYLFELK